MMAVESFSLQTGNLAFSARAMGRGPTVLCLHGFPDNISSFRYQLPALAEAGYRAVAISLRGYEPSSQAAAQNYSLPSLAADIPGILDQLETEQAHIIGHDWGAGIAYTVGALAPRRCKSLITIALPHSGRFIRDAFKYPRQVRLSWYMFFFQLAGIAEYAVQRNNYQLLRRLWRDWSPEWNVPEEVLADVIDSFRQPGVVSASLAYYRKAVSLRALAPRARAAAAFPVPVPTLAISGEQDGCIDTHVFEKLMLEQDFPAGLQFERMSGVGHFPHQEQPGQVNSLILNWLQRWQ